MTLKEAIQSGRPFMQWKWETCYYEHRGNIQRSSGMKGNKGLKEGRGSGPGQGCVAGRHPTGRGWGKLSRCYIVES